MIVELQSEGRRRMGGDASEPPLAWFLGWRGFFEQGVLCKCLVTDYESEMSGRPDRGSYLCDCGSGVLVKLDSLIDLVSEAMSYQASKPDRNKHGSPWDRRVERTIPFALSLAFPNNSQPFHSDGRWLCKTSRATPCNALYVGPSRNMHVARGTHSSQAWGATGV